MKLHRSWLHLRSQSIKICCFKSVGIFPACKSRWFRPWGEEENMTLHIVKFESVTCNHVETHSVLEPICQLPWRYQQREKHFMFTILMPQTARCNLKEILGVLVLCSGQKYKNLSKGSWCYVCSQACGTGSWWQRFVVGVSGTVLEGTWESQIVTPYLR